MSNIINVDTFDKVYQMACQFVGTKESPNEMVPKQYQGNPAAFLIAYEIAQKTGETCLSVMQNLSVIQGRPGWSSKYMIGKINSSGKYRGGLRFCLSDPDASSTNVEYVEWQWDHAKNKNMPAKKSMQIFNRSCYAYAYDIRTGEEVRGITVDYVMAIKEGWFNKSGSKWQTMGPVMLQYRAASFFASFYTPELLFGVPSVEEIQDGIVLEEQPPIQAPANVAVPFKRTYGDIESALKTMGLNVRIERENGRVWAIAEGKTFEHQADLTKLGFSAVKHEKKIITKLDVTQIEGIPELKQAELPLEAEPFNLNDLKTVFDLEEFVVAHGIAFETKTHGDKTFAKIDITDDPDEVALALALGFQLTNKGYIRDVTSLVSAAA